MHVFISQLSRDNSAGITYYYKSKEDFEKKMRTWINFKHISMGKSHYSCRNEQVNDLTK